VNTQQLEKNLKKAIALHQSKKYAEAMTLYKKILKSQPENPSALHFYGLLHYHQGKYKEATKLILASIAINPNYLDAYLNLGNVFMQSQEFSDARKCYEKVLAISPYHIGAATNLGILLKYLAEFSKSEALLSEVCKNAPNWGQGYYNLANTLVVMGKEKKAEALDTYIKAVEHDPQITSAYGPITRLSYLLNLPEKAKNVLDKWASTASDESAPVISHMLAAFSGENIPARANDTYVTKTFDGYAEGFEASLASLEYKGPQLLAEALVEKKLGGSQRLNILDAGCGTGLCSDALSPIARKLIGIDISSKMLKQAKLKQCYDRLVCQSLETAIKQYDDYFDLVVSMDTLVYFGDLEPVLTDVANAIKPGGNLIFTVEKSFKPGTYFLTQSGRYSHTEEYVEKQLNLLNFVDVQIKQTVTRKEFNQDVASLLVYAKNR